MEKQFLGSTKSRSSKISRRKTLIWLALASIITMFSQLGDIVCSILKPPQNKKYYGGIINEGIITDFPPINSHPKKFPAGRLWLIHNDIGITLFPIFYYSFSCLTYALLYKHNNYVCTPIIPPVY